jgi:hypothetical protein
LLDDSRVLQPSSQLVRDLARPQGEALVSCYVPFARAGKEVRQNAIRLKNCQRVLSAARARRSLDERTAAVATRELALAAQEDPRAIRRDGLALFAWQDQSVVLEAAAPFGPLITVAPRFYVVPLLPFVTPAQPTFVLALSRHALRVVEQATGKELPLSADVPRSVSDVVGAERRSPTLQQHSVGTGNVFHGHGEGEDDVAPEIELFCRRIAIGLAGTLDRGTATLILAGDVQIAAMFRRTAGSWTVLSDAIHGNHERTPAAELARLADPIVAARQDTARAELKTLYGARTAAHRTSADLAEIGAAARAGRIDTLLLDEAVALTDPRRRAAREPHAIQSEGPFNNEAVLTLRCGGDVRLVAASEMPTPAPHAAIYRF